MATLEFGGQEQFAAEPARLFEALTDLNGMAQTIPDLVSAEHVDSRSMRAVVRPGFSFLRGKLKLTITLSDLHPPEAATMHIAAQGIGVTMGLESQMAITSEGTGSRLAWNARIVEMTGLVATVSPGLVRAAAEQTIQNSWKSVRQRLGE